MSWNPLWESIHRERPWGLYPGEDVIRFVAGHYGRAPDRAQLRILDAGCGAGAHLWYLAREGFCAHGFDGSLTAVQRAVARLDRECPGWREAGGSVQVADFAALPYGDGVFDGVLDVASGCYSPLEQARQNYAELARVARPGARLFVRTFARGCWGDGTGRAVDADFWDCAEGPLAGHGPTRFTAYEDLPRLLAGWRIERIQRHSMGEPDGSKTLVHWVVHAQRAA